MKTTNNNSESPKLTDISGKKGQSLFHAFITRVAGKDLKLMSDNYERQLDYIKRAKDDRLLAIVGALTVEDALDILLKAYIPEYKIFYDDGRMSFYVKIKLAQSLKLIPLHLLDATEIIHRIRNKFAHNLHQSDFNSLPEKTKDGLVKIFKKISPEDDANSCSTSEMFSITVTGLLIGFGVYASNLKLAKEYIYSDEFFLKIGERFKNSQKK